MPEKATISIRLGPKKKTSKEKPSSSVSQHFDNIEPGTSSTTEYQRTITLEKKAIEMNLCDSNSKFRPTFVSESVGRNTSSPKNEKSPKTRRVVTLLNGKMEENKEWMRNIEAGGDDMQIATPEEEALSQLPSLPHCPPSTGDGAVSDHSSKKQKKKHHKKEKKKKRRKCTNSDGEETKSSKTNSSPNHTDMEEEEEVDDYKRTPLSQANNDTQKKQKDFQSILTSLKKDSSPFREDSRDRDRKQSGLNKKRAKGSDDRDRPSSRRSVDSHASTGRDDRSRRKNRSPSSSYNRRDRSSDRRRSRSRSDDNYRRRYRRSRSRSRTRSISRSPMRNDSHRRKSSYRDRDDRNKNSFSKSRRRRSGYHRNDSRSRRRRRSPTRSLSPKRNTRNSRSPYGRRRISSSSSSSSDDHRQNASHNYLSKKHSDEQRVDWRQGMSVATTSQYYIQHSHSVDNNSSGINYLEMQNQLHIQQLKEQQNPIQAVNPDVTSKKSTLQGELWESNQIISQQKAGASGLIPPPPNPPLSNVTLQGIPSTLSQSPADEWSQSKNNDNTKPRLIVRPKPIDKRNFDIMVARNTAHFGTSAIDRYKRLSQVGEGTYGQVYKAIEKDKPDGQLLALKKVRLDTEKDGFPITALRETLVLKITDHPNIINLKDICIERDKDQTKTMKTAHETTIFYFVFDYMDHDLLGILESGLVKLEEIHIRSFSKQILLGIEYCHKNRIIHRDIKCSNILVNNKGRVKLADFGLARVMESYERAYTNKVITLWYRPPELLLGADTYDGKVDMWSVGCIIAEIYKKEPLFRGHNESTQLYLIAKLCGTPDDSVWPGVTNIRNYQQMRIKEYYNRNTRRELAKFNVHKLAIELIDSLLALDPAKRPDASKSLQYEWLKDTNIDLIPPPNLPTNQDCHELWSKKRKKLEQERERAFMQSSSGNFATQQLTQRPAPLSQPPSTRSSSNTPATAKRHSASAQSTTPGTSTSGTSANIEAGVPFKSQMSRSALHPPEKKQRTDGTMHVSSEKDKEKAATIKREIFNMFTELSAIFTAHSAELNQFISSTDGKLNDNVVMALNRGNQLLQEIPPRIGFVTKHAPEQALKDFSEQIGNIQKMLKKALYKHKNQRLKAKEAAGAQPPPPPPPAATRAN